MLRSGSMVYVHFRSQASSLLPASESMKITIGPITVIEVAGEDDEIYTLGQRELDQTTKRFPRGPAQRLNWCAFIFIEPAQRAIQVDVSGVQETHGHCLNLKWHNHFVLSD
jgi:hypothetical protein